MALALMLVGLVSGCIQPIETAAPPTVTVPPLENAPPAAAPTAALDPGAADAGGAQVAPEQGTAVSLVEGFISGRGQTANNLRVWYDQPLGPDQIQGFSYDNASGLPCAGFLATSAASGVIQPTNGAIVCGDQPGIPALAAMWHFPTSDGQPYTLVFGRVEDPAIAAIAVVYSDNTNQMTTPSLGGFLVPQPGILGVNLITAISQEGNTVIDNIPQLPAS